MGFEFEVNQDALKTEHLRDKNESQDVESNVEVHRLQKGTTQVRILPPYSSAGLWFKEIKKAWLPYNGKNTPFVSPATFGRPCPFITEGQRLYNQGGEENIELAKKFRPKNSYLFNVIIYSTPTDPNFIKHGVVCLEAGTTVKKQLLEYDQDHAGGWGDITNLQSGIDVRIEKRGEGLNTEYIVKPIPKRTNVIEVLQAAGLDPKDILAPIDLDKVFNSKSDAELNSLVQQIRASFAPLSNSVPSGDWTVPTTNVGQVDKPGGNPGGGVEVPTLPDWTKTTGE